MQNKGKTIYQRVGDGVAGMSFSMLKSDGVIIKIKNKKSKRNPKKKIMRESGGQVFFKKKIPF